MGFNLGDVLKNVSNVDTAKKQIVELPISSLDSDSGNFYELRDIDALADNISVVGLQQPILVRSGDQAGRYTIISGHRRLAACKKLAEADPEHWQEIPCIIEADNASPALQQLRLIYANANTRQLTSAEISEQAQQVEKLLYDLKNEGYEFPGRMRDHVAEAVGASKTKLARLKVIRENLIQDWKTCWEKNTIHESVAYTLAQTNHGYQQLLWAASCGGSMPSAGLVEHRIYEMEKAEALCAKLVCPISRDGVCTPTNRVRRASKTGQWETLPCTGCCRDCQNLPYCSYSCELAGDLKYTQRKQIRQERDDQKAAEKAQADKAWAAKKELLTRSYDRVAQLRAEKGIGVKDFIQKSIGRCSQYENIRLEAKEAGNFEGYDQMPGDISACTVQRLIDTADLLGCSIDYLLGREVPETTSTAASVWRSGSPEEKGEYIVLYWDTIGDLCVESMRWTGSCWIIYGVEPPEDWSIRSWTEFPNLEK